MYVGLENIEPHTGKLIGEYTHEYSSIKSIKNQFEAGEILFGKLRPNLNKVWLADRQGICSTDILVLIAKNVQQTPFLYHYLLSNVFNQKVLQTISGQQLPRTSWENISHLEMAVPDKMAQQDKIAEQIAQYEAEIAACEQTIQSLPAQKQAVLAKYLQ